MSVISYTQWYDKPANDVYGGRYGELFKLFDADSGMEPTNIGSVVAADGDAKLAFVHLDQHGKIRVFHRIRRVAPLPGRTDSQDNLNVAMMGDYNKFTDLCAYFTELPPTAFDRTNKMERVLTAAAISALIARNPTEKQIPPDPQAPAKDVSAVRSRFWILIPPSLTGQVLAATSRSDGLNPRDLWLKIVAPMDEALRRDCAPFIDWCRLAYSAGVEANNPLQTPRPVILNEGHRLTQCRCELLRSDLPDCFYAPPAGAVDPMASVVQALHSLKDTYVEIENRKLQSQIPTPTRRWDDTLEKLYRLCGVTDEANLPPLWSAMARRGVEMDRNTIQYYLDRKDVQLGYAGHRRNSVMVTAALVADLGRLHFIGRNDDCIDVGLSIFACLRPLGDDPIINDAPTLTLPNARNSDEQTFKLPATYYGVKKVCATYHRLLAITLGIKHPVTGNFASFLDRMEMEEMHFEKFFEDDIQRCTGFLRNIQISMHLWMEDSLDGRSAKPPDFKKILTLIFHYQWRPIPIPDSFITKPVAPIASRQSKRSAPTRNSVRISAPPGTSLAPPMYNFCPTTYIRTHGPPPQNNQGGSICLSYHVIGYCVSDCPRAVDHRLHTAAETARLQEYLAQGEQGES